MPSEIRTFSGQAVNPLLPHSVSIFDIAHALSLICRYGGHCPVHYSVAQHSLIVMHSALLRAAVHIPNASPEWLINEVALPALLHDAHEAYVGDIVTPAKDNDPGLAAIEARCAEQVRFLLGVKAPPGWICEIDKEVGARERELFWRYGLTEWVMPAGTAWVPFITAYNNLRLGSIPETPATMKEFWP